MIFIIDFLSITHILILRPDHLRSHLVSHTGIKDFQCEICSKRFAKAYDLTEHRRGHSGERPYVCKPCNRAFARHGEFRVSTRYMKNIVLVATFFVYYILFFRDIKLVNII